MFAFLSYRFTSLDDEGLGRTISISFLIMNAVAAVLPALVLQPLTNKFRRVNVHAACLAIMAVGYAAGYFIGYSTTTIYLLMAVIGVGWAAIA